MTTKKEIFTVLVAILISSLVQAQSPKAEYGSFALTNATVHTVTNGTLENTTLLIRDGEIAEIGDQTSFGQDVEIIDCTGKHIFPGMIDSGTRLGLTEVGSVSLTQDYNEVGNIIPHMEALTAINPNSALIPVTRVSGVTTTLSVPAGGLFPGKAALINLHGYTSRQMHTGFSAPVFNFPSLGKRGSRDRRSDEEIKKAYEKAMAQVNEVWEKVRQYHVLDSARAAGNTEAELGYYPEMQALLPVFRGEMPLLVEVNRAEDIKNAIEWIEEKEIRAILTGVSDGFRVAGEIADANLPVIVGPMLSTPSRDYDRYDKPYANPGLLKDAGVKVAIRTMEAENVRNLPYNAGFAAAYGMSEEDALEAITIVPAEIFDVADKMGSIEVGKQATLFISTGHPFETATDVEQVFIKGWKMPMVSRHTQLYEEFLERSPGLRN